MSIADQVAAWPETCQLEGVFDFSNEGELRYQSNRNAALVARLRTTAEALRAATTWAAPMRDAPKSARPAWFDDARAILAQLEKEGLA